MIISKSKFKPVLGGKKNLDNLAVPTWHFLILFWHVFLLGSQSSRGTLAVKTMAPCKALVEEHASKTGRSVSWTAINGNEGYFDVDEGRMALDVNSVLQFEDLLVGCFYFLFSARIWMFGCIWWWFPQWLILALNRWTTTNHFVVVVLNNPMTIFSISCHINTWGIPSLTKISEWWNQPGSTLKDLRSHQMLPAQLLLVVLWEMDGGMRTGQLEGKFVPLIMHLRYKISMDIWSVLNWCTNISQFHWHIYIYINIQYWGTVEHSRSQTCWTNIIIYYIQ